MSQVLVLNNTYEPLHVVDLQRAVRLLFARKAEVIADRGTELHSAGRLGKEIVAFPLPSIIRLLYYVAHRRTTLSLTKKNVLLRDDHTCGYCGKQNFGKQMTVDHILPKSRRGPSSWTNLVACCEPCNGRKRDRTPAEAGMRLLRKPYAPRYIPWMVVKRNTVPGEWAKYLGLYEVGIEERPA